MEIFFRKKEFINIKDLIFDKSFKQPLKHGVIPSSVITLTFGDKFN